MTLQDTFKIHHDTCILDASSVCMLPWATTINHKKPSRCPLQPPAKKQKGGKGAAQAPVPAVAPAKAPKARGKAKESPQVRSSKRGRK